MKQVDQFIKKHKKFVVVQADNPDGDSLASSLALEQILHQLKKDSAMYCSVDIPTYLRYMPGWDRVSNELPDSFEAVIIVDTPSANLLEAADKAGAMKWIRAKPTLVIDHHSTEMDIDFANVAYQKPVVACGELIYDLAKGLDWPLNQTSREMLAAAILSDSLGLTSESVSPHSIRIVADLVENGVNLAKLDNMRKQAGKKSQRILKLKGRLLDKVEYSDDSNVAMVTIPWEDIEKFSHEYNPSMLVLDDMRQVENVKVAVAFKTYPDDRITGKIRCNFGFAVADKLAEHFGGGGHPYASGFRVVDGRKINQIKTELIKRADQLLAK